jgi:hypothetical protein
VWIDYCLSECGWLCGLRGFVHDVDLAGAPPTLPRTTAEYFTVGRSLCRTPCVGRRLACFPLECICWPTYSGPKVNSDCCLCVRPSVGLSGWGSPGRLRNHHAEVLRGSRPACPFRTSSVPTLQRALYKFRLLLSHTECYPVVSICRHPTTCVGTGILQSRLQAGSIKTRSRLCPPAWNLYLIRGHGRNFSPPIKKDRD